MTALILSFPAETSQQEADRALAIWQEQRKAGVPTDQRQIPDDSFNRDIEILRKVMERTR